MKLTNSRAFTLIEILVTIAVIAMLLAILMPALLAAKQKSKQILCLSNLRQLVVATTAYTQDNDSSLPLAASDIFTENKHRWYGKRESINDPFDTAKGPLASYLQGQNLNCTAKVKYAKVPPTDPKYDEGSGGYGYNMVYLGSVISSKGYGDESFKTSAKITSVKQPSETLTFADTAMANSDYLTEYPFAEPRYFVVDSKPVTDAGWDPLPSIHFRHRRRANIGWVDGSATSKKMGKYEAINNAGINMSDMKLGWFEPMSNKLFDLK